MKKLIFILFFLISLSTIAQQKKSEKEERISKEEMPQKALLFLRNFENNKTKKNRFYFEIDSEKKGYEAKFKIASFLYSVEFGEKGNLQDIEIVKDFDSINPLAKKTIQTYFKENYAKFNVEKVQLQFKKQRTETEKETYNRAINHRRNKPDYYEFIVKVKIQKERKRLEILFDSSGNFKKQREIAESSYDYFMY
ncbi:hypothetical protein [Mesonia aquimarina]|uniref:hypothetical protein n=1 Tax=Mesonia aquimarina TaxID=1504967 RepID=UPI000EF5FFDF|nr:hypothetical protein [Mesonia aquimarina]